MRDTWYVHYTHGRGFTFERTPYPGTLPGGAVLFHGFLLRYGLERPVSIRI